jgi:DNA-binding CsgD family transcriptional regulator
VLYAPIIMPELAEAAYRIGDLAPVRAVLERLSERSRVTPNDWAQGIEARVRAFIGEGSEADHSYRESVKRLRNTPLRAELARSQLLYGEWLRRERRRGEAREQLRAAHEAFAEMGMRAFAERARRELIIAGEAVRKRAARSARTHGDPAGEALTSQEAQVARLARDGLSNPEIAARLFISPRTVQYHLSKVFTKLGISSRGQLHLVLPGEQI